MQIPTWLYIIIMIAVLGGYWWYKYGRHTSGGQGSAGYLKHKFQTRDGENLAKTFNGSFHIEMGAADVGAALVGMQRVGKALIIGLTDQNRVILAYATTEEPPIQLEKKQVNDVNVIDHKKLDRMDVIQINLKDGSNLKINIQPEGAKALQEWAL